MIDECLYNDFDRKDHLAFASKAVHGALGCDPCTGSVSFPIYQSATFKHKTFGVGTGFYYTRLENPTRQELERTMAILEGGLEAFAFTSGQAANMALFGMLKKGDHVLLSDDIYGGTFRICDTIFTPLGIEFTYVDMSELDEVKAAIRPETKMFFIETPTNPMMKVADIAELSKIAKANGALTVVDNTFMTPYFQKPIELGADIVVHSATKYIGGHNDVVAGMAIVTTKEQAEHFTMQIKSRGNGLGPFESWLLLRGLKTLPLRMDKHHQNSLKVANWLRTQPKVKKVYYVGFEDHKDYAVTMKQTTGFSGMISFELDSFESAKKMLSDVKMVLFAESLGGVETLLTYPLTQTHESTPPDVREKLGINDRFLRISIGIEDADDIIADLDQALNG
ncbi:MAG: PLP-dependent aspartate aminotransferase family protein [Lachnospiraceae bacterium]|nr:PLP-dependent aspartate aminotransferase family protein [Lachnospiraceae bacterium]